jgi:hypothetical protein
MCLHKPGVGLLIIFSSLFAAGCGELDAVLSSSLSPASTYRVNAAIEGRTLDECAVVSVNSRIRPYFANPVEGDPDITGLVVFLKTPTGEVVSRKVRYVIGSAGQDSGLPITTDTDSDGRISGQDASGTGEGYAGQTDSGKTDSGKADSGEYGKTEVSLPADDAASPGQAEANAGSTDNVDVADNTDIAGQGASPAGTGGTVSPVYQILQKESFAEETAEPDELVVSVSKLDGELPALLFPEKLAIGPYILVLQVLGLRDVLSHSEKLIYYVADAELTLGDIQTYHSGAGENSGVVTPGSIIMLETKVSADKRLKPYIVWYNGKRRIREGPVSEGVDRLLWQSPGQTGFQALRAEIFPFVPLTGYQNNTGVVKELSLAVSSKQTKRSAGLTETLPENITRWYQLGAVLYDSLAASDAGRELAPADDTVITWLPKAGIYGLAAGPAHSFTIPGSLFTPDEKLPGRGRLSFRFAPLSSGIIFSGAFALGRTSQTLNLNLSFNADANLLILTYALGREERKQEVYLSAFGRDDWITAAVDFTVRNNEFLAGLSLLSEESVPAGSGIVLPGALSGKGIFRIGAAAVSDAVNAAADTTAKSGTDTASDGGINLASSEEIPDTGVVPAVTEPAAAGIKSSAPVVILDAIIVVFSVDSEETVIETAQANSASGAGTELAGAGAVSANASSPEEQSPEKRPRTQPGLAGKTGPEQSRRQRPQPAVKAETQENTRGDPAGGEALPAANPDSGDKEASQHAVNEEADIPGLAEETEEKDPLADNIVLDTETSNLLTAEL